MGNLKDLRRECEHLKRQNAALIASRSRSRAELVRNKEETAEALSEISKMLQAYLGAICLHADGQHLRIRHEDIKHVINNYSIEIESDGEGFTVRLCDK